MCLHWPELVVDLLPVAFASGDGRVEQVFRKPRLVPGGSADLTEASPGRWSVPAPR